MACFTAPVSPPLGADVHVSSSGESEAPVRSKPRWGLSAERRGEMDWLAGSSFCTCDSDLVRDVAESDRIVVSICDASEEVEGGVSRCGRTIRIEVARLIDVWKRVERRFKAGMREGRRNVSTRSVKSQNV
jgi:hypothetical protein